MQERGKNRMTTILEAIPEVMIIFGFMLLLCAVAAIGEGIRFAVFAIKYVKKEHWKCRSSKKTKKRNYPVA